ncbi:hypothetical protein D027_4308A, partial [Vibrio parahaemolyticus 861]
MAVIYSSIFAPSG